MFPAMCLSKSVSAYSPSSFFEAKDHVGGRCGSRDQRQCDHKNWSCVSNANQCIHCFPSPFDLMFELAGPERAKNLAVDKSPPDSDPLSVAEYGKIVFRFVQNNSSQVRIADSSRTKQLPSLPAYSLPACFKLVSG